MRTQSTLTTPGGITWYYEQEGTGPHHIVLIPDGIGDCALFSLPMSLIASSDLFTVTTFEMPGMSRSTSTTTPPETYQDITAPKLAHYVISLLDALVSLGKLPSTSTAAAAAAAAADDDDGKITFWGSSSGGATVLALAALYPDRVRNGIVHEVPTVRSRLRQYPSAWRRGDFDPPGHTDAAGFFVGDAGAWEKARPLRSTGGCGGTIRAGRGGIRGRCRGRSLLLRRLML